MTTRLSLLASGMLLAGCGLVGCGALTTYFDESARETRFFGIVFFDFDAAKANDTQDELETLRSTNVHLPEDLFGDAPESVSIVLKASDLLVTFDNDAVLMPTQNNDKHHIAVKFGVAQFGLDVCATTDLIGTVEGIITDDGAVLNAESIRLSAEMGSIVRTGDFALCVQASADFGGQVSLRKFSLEYGVLDAKKQRIEICHVPPDDPDNQHTITVAESAVSAHLGHGDYLGSCDSPEPDDEAGDDAEPSEEPDSGDPGDDGGTTIPPDPGAVDTDADGVVDADDVCEGTPIGELADTAGCSCSQLDEDGDGVSDCDDFCPDTAVKVAVDTFGCAVLMIDAGDDVVHEQVGCVTLQASASGGTPPYVFSWSAPGWSGSLEQTPSVVPNVTTTYMLTVTDFSFPPATVTDTVTITLNSTPVSYSIIDLGSLSTNSSFPAGINDAGDVVGFYFSDTFKKRAFLYSQGQMTDIGTLGGTEASAIDINNAGQIVGESKTANGDWHAFVWESVGGMRDLDTLGGSTSVANAINDFGQIAGSSATGVTTHAFMYDNDVMVDVDLLNSAYSEAYGINVSGRVVGTFFPNNSDPQALIYDDGALLGLSSPLLSANRVWDVNGSGHMVGHSWEMQDFRSFLNVCDTTVDIGSLAAYPKVSAWDINDAGQIVGSAAADMTIEFTAFVYTGGMIADLNDVLLPGHPWERLFAAFAINNVGQITGYGKINGQFHGFLLTPAP